MNWPSIFLWLPLLLDILGNKCIIIICYAVNVKILKITLAFLSDRFSTWQKRSIPDLNILRTKRYLRIIIPVTKSFLDILQFKPNTSTLMYSWKCEAVYQNTFGGELSTKTSEITPVEFLCYTGPIETKYSRMDQVIFVEDSL